MWLVLAFCISQDVPLPPDRDRSVPLTEPKSTGAKESKPLAPAATSRGKRLVERPESGPDLGGVALWTCFVLAIMAGAFVLFRRMSRGSKLFGAAASIDVLGKKGLGPRQAIYLVEVAGKVLVVGATRDRLSTLGEIGDAEAVAGLRVKVGRAGEAQAFRSSLRSGLREFEKETPSERPGEVQGLLEELSELKRTVGAWRA